MVQALAKKVVELAFFVRLAHGGIRVGIAGMAQRKIFCTDDLGQACIMVNTQQKTRKVQPGIRITMTELYAGSPAADLHNLEMQCAKVVQWMFQHDMPATAGLPYPGQQTYQAGIVERTLRLQGGQIKVAFAPYGQGYSHCARTFA